MFCVQILETILAEPTGRFTGIRNIFIFTVACPSQLTTVTVLVITVKRR